MSIFAALLVVASCLAVALGSGAAAGGTTAAAGSLAALAASVGIGEADGPTAPLTDEDTCSLLQVPDHTHVALGSSLMSLPPAPDSDGKFRILNPSAWQHPPPAPPMTRASEPGGLLADLAGNDPAPSFEEEVALLARASNELQRTLGNGDRGPPPDAAAATLATSAGGSGFGGGPHRNHDSKVIVAAEPLPDQPGSKASSLRDSRGIVQRSREWLQESTQKLRSAWASVAARSSLPWKLANRSVEGVIDEAVGHTKGLGLLHLAGPSSGAGMKGSGLELGRGTRFALIVVCCAAALALGNGFVVSGMGGTSSNNDPGDPQIGQGAASKTLPAAYRRLRMAEHWRRRPKQPERVWQGRPLDTIKEGFSA
mmetsp:Transcript_78392/g.196860  ORF Transcript_78392/g.196860 Transcript_78392/m.196860 type:complete len:369 (-) Transcript_78392:30-1136(-)